MSTGKIQKYYNNVYSPIQLYSIDDIDDEIRRQREERKRQGGELVCIFRTNLKKNLSNNTKLYFQELLLQHSIIMFIVIIMERKTNNKEFLGWFCCIWRL